jgi:hypothetical protein
MCPIATNTPVTSRSRSVPVIVSRSRTPVTLSVPCTATTSLFQANSSFGSANARSAMIFDARSWSRR